MPLLEITVHGHLLVAGSQVPGLGVDLATARRSDGRGLVPYIPATALRGAVRLQLEALLQGAGRGGIGPYPLDDGIPRERLAGDLVARLFGYSGERGSRSGAQEGLLRFGDALPVDGPAAARAVAVRPGLELDDHLGTAAERKLFFREVAEAAAAPLVFRAELDTGGAVDEEIRVLRAAIETTDALGAGKAKGGGAVSIRWLYEPGGATTSVVGDPASAARARLTFTLREPAHLGDGGPAGNHHATRTWVPGATVRGAVAWALLRAGTTAPDSSEFRALFLDEADPVSFGDALPTHTPEVDPAVRPATRRECRSADKQPADVLISELARERVNRALEAAGSPVRLRADDGAARFDPVSARPAHDLLKRTRTRVSIDRHTGTAMDGRLFSIEQLEPWLATKTPGEAARRATFVSWVEGLTPAAATLLAELDGVPLFLGAGRHHGLGSVDAEVRFEAAPEPAGAEEAVLALARAIDASAAAFAAQAGVAAPGVQAVPLALVASSDYVPGDPSAPHPLAEAGLAGLPEVAGLSRTFLNAGAAGGYDQRQAAAPLKDLLPAIGAGSVFVYDVEPGALPGLLARLLPALRRGVGRRVDSGCGRFELFRPIRSERVPL